MKCLKCFFPNCILPEDHDGDHLVKSLRLVQRFEFAQRWGIRCVKCPDVATVATSVGYARYISLASAMYQTETGKGIELCLVHEAEELAKFAQPEALNRR
jgi:hypothetical protein